MKNKTAQFGTIDSWILYKLHGGHLQNNFTEHISDVTNCAATGFYDPFSLCWASWALTLFSIQVIVCKLKINITSYNIFIISSHIIN